MDRVDYLHRVLACEARIIEAQTDLAAIKGTRRRILDEQIARMRRIALGEFDWEFHSAHRRLDELWRLQVYAGAKR